MNKFASPIYFWYLNTKLEPSELRRQLREMRKMGVKGVCPHPWPPEFRPATMPSDMSPEYLSDAYLDRFEVIYRVHLAKIANTAKYAQLITSAQQVIC